MSRIEVVTDSAAATERVAAAAAGGLVPGDVVLLEGDLGTGKTTFVRAACRALGVTDNVTSPSFTIGRRYRGRAPVSHVDLFRLDTLDGEEPGLLLDYLDAETIAFVEWPRDLIASPGSLAVRLSHLGEDRRRIELEGRDELVRLVPG